MTELQVDQTEIGLIMMGLNSIDDAQLTEDGKTARARLAYKLGAAYADALLPAARERIAGLAAEGEAVRDE